MDEKAAENRFFFLLKLQAFFFLASQRLVWLSTSKIMIA
jgi:hypothetical protein